MSPDFSDGTNSPLMLLAKSKLVPVVSFYSIDQALFAIELLLEVSIRVVEITLRTPMALQIMAAVAKQRPEMMVAAGTVLTVQQLQQVQQAGAQVGLSPGISVDLLESARNLSFAFIPGVATASEILLGINYGWQEFKFFPAEFSGGIAGLKALAAPFAAAQFCPTGGVNSENFLAYLNLPMVKCVGMSQLLPDRLLDRYLTLASDTEKTVLRRELLIHLRSFTSRLV